MKSILQVKNLSITYNEKERVVNDVSFLLNKGENLGIVGESGSGKTSIAMAIMGLINKSAKVQGEIFYKDVNFSSLDEKKLNKYRWKRISVVFQNSKDVLNPVLSISEQLSECMTEHTNLNKKEIKNRISELLNMVGLDPLWKNSYPHELSGGMVQKVLIAMALSCNPEILIVDEPTTALDSVSKNVIIDLLRNLERNKNITVILISHDLSVISKLTSKLIVMYKGCIMEYGDTKDILKNPYHTYTRGLINSCVDINPYQDLWGIASSSSEKCENGCPFYFRCNQKIDICKSIKPNLKNININRLVACNRGGIVTLLNGENISKNYTINKKVINACNKCNISVRSGEVVALIGQSGSGKTTLSSILSGILKQDSGKVYFNKKEVIGNNTTSVMGGIQMIFQDPISATDGFATVFKVIKEPLDILKIGTKESRKKQVIKVLNYVELSTDEEFMNKKCYTLSGGQRQRIAIARSLIMKPKLLIADEISSMLDPSTKANILRLLKGIQNAEGFSMIYITHDLSLARKIANVVYVMYKGEIIEKGSTIEIFNNPKVEYTKKLIKTNFNCNYNL